MTTLRCYSRGDAVAATLPATVRWFNWDGTLAVVDGFNAFAVGRTGWRSVNEADVTWDGDEISEASARHIFDDDLMLYGDPPIPTPPASAWPCEPELDLFAPRWLNLAVVDGFNAFPVGANDNLPSPG